VVYDNEVGAQYLYGGVGRMQANIATSQAAYAEAAKRMDSLTSARPSLRPLKQRRRLQRVELD
jgi:hypothetical protein